MHMPLKCYLLSLSLDSGVVPRKVSLKALGVGI